MIIVSPSLHLRLQATEEYIAPLDLAQKDMPISREEVTTSSSTSQFSARSRRIDFRAFAVRGDVLDIFPISSASLPIRVEFFGSDEVERHHGRQLAHGRTTWRARASVAIFPASHYATNREKLEAAIDTIWSDAEARRDSLNAWIA